MSQTNDGTTDPSESYDRGSTSEVEAAKQELLKVIRKELIDFAALPEIAYAGDFIGMNVFPPIEVAIIHLLDTARNEGKDKWVGDAPTTPEITEENFWKFDRRVRALIKSYGWTPVNDLITSIHAAAKQYYSAGVVQPRPPQGERST